MSPSGTEDCLITGGRVVDGTGNPWFHGDVVLRGDRVARVELFHVAIPLPATFRPAWIPGMPSNENRFTLVRITTDDGIEGYSAGPAIENPVIPVSCHSSPP